MTIYRPETLLATAKLDWMKKKAALFSAVIMLVAVTAAVFLPEGVVAGDSLDDPEFVLLPYNLVDTKVINITQEESDAIIHYNLVDSSSASAAKFIHQVTSCGTDAANTILQNATAKIAKSNGFQLREITRSANGPISINNLKMRCYATVRTNRGRGAILYRIDMQGSSTIEVTLFLTGLRSDNAALSDDEIMESFRKASEAEYINEPAQSARKVTIPACDSPDVMQTLTHGLTYGNAGFFGRVQFQLVKPPKETSRTAETVECIAKVTSSVQALAEERGNPIEPFIATFTMRPKPDGTIYLYPNMLGFQQGAFKVSNSSDKQKHYHQHSRVTHLE